MLTKLFLEKFMSYNERTEIELAPLTVILGPNSSGKSSVLRALRTLRDFPNLNWDIESGPAHRSKAGGFRIGVEISGRRSLPRHIDDQKTPDVLESEVAGIDYEFDSASSNLISAMGFDRSLGVYRAHRSRFWNLEGSFDPLVGEDAGFFDFLNRPLWGEDVEFWDIEIDGITSRVEEPLSRGQHLILPFLHRILRDDTGSFVDMKFPSAPGFLHGLLQVWNEVPPIRTMPDRITDSPWDENQISSANRWFEALGVEYEIGLQSLVFEENLPDERNREHSYVSSGLFRQFLIDRRTNSRVWLTEIGVGVSQLIPVILACAKSQRRQETGSDSSGGPLATSLLTIEQPELHLHPRLQSEMAELLADTVWTRSDGFLENEPDIESTGVQVLVETHSEHLVLRLQSLVRRKLIPHDEISLLYVWIENGSSKVKRIHLNSRGEFLDEWPEGFFDERLQEILGWSDDI